ncbi:amidohydrolase family protein [Pedobacter sp. MC2016-14]|uniref:amidohydrolase family protein n=1 Tax=Pedobacter sp. MC2016-14 TaxID=2897327 RepID=UPI001E2CCA92|nr:amidohydrolase family protein [Pedobacter sp. MC2016-14]MCD0488945.1 amidohydrolase family protein [Pedobacter sp. MC2016-14]
MLKIDAHQHFWVFDPVRDSWIGDDMAILQDDFMPAHLQPILEHYGFMGSVAVQSDQSADETHFLLQQTEQNPFIKGVVGWIDLQAADITEQLEAYRRYDKLKGFRHILQGEKQRDLMLEPAFKNGIGQLKQFGYTYDVLIFPDQLGYAAELAATFPDQPFVLDHIAKPGIKDNADDAFKSWSAAIAHLAKQENVWCKVSGMVTEADLRNWKKADFKRYLDVVFEHFGVNRLMFGSDWPVCRLAATYGEVLSIMEAYLSSFSEQEQALFWSGNAAKFYNLSI